MFDLFDPRLSMRFWDKIAPEPNSGCWIWCGSITTGGYGHLTKGGANCSAHRVAYIAFKGPIPEGLEIDHLCRVRSCSNPNHLEAVTRSENNRRGISHGGHNNRAKTHCKRGHPFSGDNLIIRNNIHGRECRECRNARKRKYWADRK